jgi:hypothetical protein
MKPAETLKRLPAGPPVSDLPSALESEIRQASGQLVSLKAAGLRETEIIVQQLPHAANGTPNRVVECGQHSTRQPLRQCLDAEPPQSCLDTEMAHPRRSSFGAQELKL